MNNVFSPPWQPGHRSRSNGCIRLLPMRTFMLAPSLSMASSQQLAMMFPQISSLLVGFLIADLAFDPKHDRKMEAFMQGPAAH